MSLSGDVCCSVRPNVTALLLILDCFALNEDDCEMLN